MNCWEFINCKNSEACPAYPSQGTRCALCLGTRCNGETQNTYDDKLRHCSTCDYFKSGFHVRTVD